MAAPKKPIGNKPGAPKKNATKGLVIRLDDLIPKQDVSGGGRVLFGTAAMKSNKPTAKDKTK